MNEELKKLLLAFVVKTTGKTAEEVSSLLFKTEADVETIQANALDGLLELDRTRVAGFTSSVDAKVKEAHDKGFNKAKAESLAKLEGEIKEKYGISEDKKGLDLIDAVIAAKASTGAETDEEKIKRSTVFLNTVDRMKKEKEDAVKEWQDKFDGREIQLKKEASFKTISEKALAYIDSLNPVLPTDAAKAANQKKIILNQLNDFDFEIKEDGKIVVLKKDGDTFKVYQDGHGNMIPFEEVVKEKANSFWDFKSGESRSGTGNKNGDNGNGDKKGYTGPAPKDAAEYTKMISEAKSLEEKAGIMKLWEEGQK